MGTIAEWLPVLIYGFTLTFGLSTPIFLILDKDEMEDMMFGSGGIMTRIFLSWFLVYFPFTFGLLARQLYYQYFPHWFLGVKSSSILEWARLGYEYAANVWLFDAPEIFGFNISNISQITVGAQTLCFAFHLIAEFVILAGIIQIIRSHQNIREVISQYLEFWR